MAEASAWVTPEVDTERPSIARLYDYLLGGTHNLEPDRQLGRQAMRAAPGLVLLIRESRKFLRRSVRYSLEQGIDQFLDLGSGIPTRGSVHETVAPLNPAARIVYVDRDPVAVAHGNELLAGNPNAASVQANLLDPDEVLNTETVGSLLDFSRPVAVLALCVLQFFSDSEVLPALERYRERLAPGSLLIISTATDEGDDGSSDRVGTLYAQEFGDFALRSHDQMRALFGDFEMVEPGVTFPTQWHPDKPSDVGAHPERYTYLVGVGRKR
jgi:SAM-dependent methyltransferase